jgi:hypothetical protein
VTIDLPSLGLGILVGTGATLVGLTIYRSRFAPAAPREAALRASLRDVRKGGAICLGGFGDEGDDLHLFIDGYGRCERGPESWHELEGDYRGRRVGVEWREADDGLKVIAFRRRRVAPDEAKVDFAAVEKAEKTPGTTIEIDGAPYRVEKVGEGLRHVGGHAMGVPVKWWDLAAPEQHAFVRVERERDGPPRVSVGKAVAADAVEIFRVKAEATS